MSVTWTKKFNANICQSDQTRSDEKKLSSDLPKKIFLKCDLLKIYKKSIKKIYLIKKNHFKKFFCEIK